MQASEKAKVYVATAQAFDMEMQAKIDDHIFRRGPGWTTIEAPFDAAARLGGLSADQICLFDCATMWLANQMQDDALPDAEQARLMAAIDGCRAELVVVSNEVGQGIVPENSLARRFREAQGRLNIALAQQADIVVHVVAGLPRVLKAQST